LAANRYGGMLRLIASRHDDDDDDDEFSMSGIHSGVAWVGAGADCNFAAPKSHELPDAPFITPILPPPPADCRQSGPPFPAASASLSLRHWAYTVCVSMVVMMMIMIL